jgi:hypothetical protein
MVNSLVDLSKETTNKKKRNGCEGCYGKSKG